MFELDLIYDLSQRTYLKRMALDSVANYVARTMSLLKVRIKNGDRTIVNDWSYILNVRPNSDKAAADFWQRVFYKLIIDNEVLIILNDSNELLIAEDYTRKEFANYEDYFHDVYVKGYAFERSFPMSEVLFLEYNDENLESFTEGLFKDYGELFGRMIEVAMRNNQIRGSVSMESTGTFNDEKDENGKTRGERFQGFIDKIYKSFKTSSVAIVPKLKGFDYEEYTNKMGVSNQSLDELDKTKKSLISDISRFVGVSPALVLGEMADLEKNSDATMANCFKPLIKKLEDELKSKILTKSEYLNGYDVEVVGIAAKNIIELATQIDKIVSSSAFTVDEVRKELEYEPLPNGEGKERIRTKNYELAKGGEDDDSSD